MGALACEQQRWHERSPCRFLAGRPSLKTRGCEIMSQEFKTGVCVCVCVSLGEVTMGHFHIFLMTHVSYIRRLGEAMRLT